MQDYIYNPSYEVEKVKMYERMGYKDLGISASVWGGEIRGLYL